jgi:hypothetical protein
LYFLTKRLINIPDSEFNEGGLLVMIDDESNKVTNTFLKTKVGEEI